MEASKHRSRNDRMGSSKRVPPYLLLVLLAIGAAVVSVGILHTETIRKFHIPGHTRCPIIYACISVVCRFHLVPESAKIRGVQMAIYVMQNMKY